MGARKSVDPRVHALIDELTAEAQKQLRDISSRFSNKTEVQRARTAYETYTDTIRRIAKTFELDIDVLRTLAKSENEAVSGLRLEGEYGRGPYFNERGYGGQRPPNVYLHSFSLFVGRQQHLAHYEWSGKRWNHGTITKVYQSGRETRGTTITQYDQQKYWTFLDGQDVVRD